MQNIFRLLLIAVLSVSFSLSAKKSDDWYKIPAEEFQDAIYDFPAEGTWEYKFDYEMLLKLQDSRSEEECQFGRYLKWPNFKTFFGKDKPAYLDDSQLPVDFDYLLTEQEVEKYKKFMNRVLRYSSKVTKYYKELYGRDRPSRINPDVKPCAEVPDGKKSYPSSHTAKGVLLGCLFAEKFRSQGDNWRANRFINYGEYMGEMRVIIGVHHPSDVDAGRTIGYAICETLLKHEQFKKDFEAL